MTDLSSFLLMKLLVQLSSAPSTFVCSFIRFRAYSTSRFFGRKSGSLFFTWVIIIFISGGCYVPYKKLTIRKRRLTISQKTQILTSRVVAAANRTFANLRNRWLIIRFTITITRALKPAWWGWLLLGEAINAVLHSEYFAISRWHVLNWVWCHKHGVIWVNVECLSISQRMEWGRFLDVDSLHLSILNRNMKVEIEGVRFFLFKKT